MMGMWRTVQRTMILTLGPRAEAIAARLQERLERRHGGLPVVAVVRADAGEDNPSDATLAEAWLSISHADHRHALTEREFRLEDADEVALYVLADLNGDQRIRTVEALTRQAQEAARRALRVLAVATGFLLLPSTGDEEPGAAEGQPLEELASSGYSLGQLFTGGLYLLGQMNSHGLVLTEEPWRERVAEGLYLLLTSPLRHLLDVSTWPGGGSTARFGSFGLAWLPSPAGEIVSHFAHRWRREAVRLLLSPWFQEREIARTARRELAQSPWMPPRLDEEWFRPAELARRLVLPVEPYMHPSPLRLSDWRSVLDEAHRDRARALEAARTSLRQTLEQASDVWQEVLKEQLAVWLDSNPVGALRRAEVGLTAWEETLAAWIEGVGARNEEYVEALAQIEVERAKAAERLDQLVAQFPRPTLAGLWSLLWRPDRWLRLLAAYRQVNERTRRYLAFLESDLQTRLNLAVGEAIACFYTAAVKHVAEQRKRIRALRGMLESVPSIRSDQSSTQTSDHRSSGDMKLWEPLYEPLYEEMMGDGVAPLRACLREHGPLSRWLEEAEDAETLSQTLEAHARRWLKELSSWPAEIFVAQRYPDEDRLCGWFADFVAEAMPLCRFDPACLTDEERTQVVAVRMLTLAPGRGEAEPNPLASCVRRYPEPITVLHREAGLPLVAFTAVCNLPARALWP